MRQEKSKLSSDEPEESKSSRSLLGTTRRRFVAGSSATWASVSLAGCLGGDGDNGNETNGGDTDQTTTYVVTDEVVAGEGVPEGLGDIVSAGQAQRTFVPGMEVIFKIGVWDPSTGDIVSDNTIDQATVSLDRGTDVELEFSSTDREWTGSWMIPEDAELGTVSYTVEVTNGQEFVEVGIAQNQIEIADFKPDVANYVVTADTVAIDDGGGGYAQSCLPQHNFTSGMAVRFDIGIYDGGSGEPVGPDVVDSATLEFSEGDPASVDLAWQGDAEDGGPFWEAVWRGIPEGYEGTIEYEVQVTNEDEEFHNVGVWGDSLEVIADPSESEVPNYVVTTDTVSLADRASGYVQSCLPQHNFTPDMAVRFDVGIYDAETGDPVGSDVVDSATLEFSDGDPASVDLAWQGDAEDGGPFWEAVWRGIPEGFEGTINYEVQVTSDGNFHDVGVYGDSIEVIPKPDL